MNEFVERFTESAQRGHFVQLVLSSPVRSVEPNIQKISVRPVEVNAEVVVQFTRHEANRETHQNLTVQEAPREVLRLFGVHFRHAHLFTTSADVTAKMRASGKLKMLERPPTKTTVSTQHNRAKQHLIPDGVPCPFLAEIGVMNADGRVYSAKYDKFRQVNRFLEFVEDIYETLPESGVLRIIDFGCGKSYLTFAMHHLLVTMHGREVEMLGVDLKEDVIESCQGIARRLGCDGLEFKTADVNDIEPPGPVDLVVSLHACDTATDVALARAIAWGSRGILSVPCCRHEFASKMNHELLPSVHGHGILHERFAEMATDAYRAQMLEASGYRAQVVEFIDLEHTARNLLIRATRRPHSKVVGHPRDVADGLVSRLGVERPILADLLDASHQERDAH